MPEGDAESAVELREEAVDSVSSRVDTARIPESPDGGGGFLRAIARTVLWPLRRFFDPRLASLRSQLSEQMAHVSSLVEADLDDTAEAAAVIGQGITEVRALGESTEATLRRIEDRLTGASVRQLADGGRVEELDEAASLLANYAASHDGFAAQRNLWFNWPLSVTHLPGHVALANVNERIVEVAYAFRALAEIESGARILDVGASESTVSLSLASLGYEVTAIDPRPYPVEHPRLRVVVGSIEEWEPGETFAAVLCISTLEHIGSGEYGQSSSVDADATALRRLHLLTEPNGLLILTTPYAGARPATEARVYDRTTLQTLLGDWHVEDFTVIAREDATTWSSTSQTDPVGEAVALVTARRRA